MRSVFVLMNCPNTGFKSNINAAKAVNFLIHKKGIILQKSSKYRIIGQKQCHISARIFRPTWLQIYSVITKSCHQKSNADCLRVDSPDFVTIPCQIAL